MEKRLVTKSVAVTAFELENPYDPAIEDFLGDNFEGTIDPDREGDYTVVFWGINGLCLAKPGDWIVAGSENYELVSNWGIDEDYLPESEVAITKASPEFLQQKVLEQGQYIEHLRESLNAMGETIIALATRLSDPAQIVLAEDSKDNSDQLSFRMGCDCGDCLCGA